MIIDKSKESQIMWCYKCRDKGFALEKEIQSLREQVKKLTKENVDLLDWQEAKHRVLIEQADQLSKYREVVEAVIEELKDDPTLDLRYHEYAIEALSKLKDEGNE